MKSKKTDYRKEQSAWICSWFWKACRKPGSVLPVVITGTIPATIEATIIYLGRTLLHSSSDQPGRASGKGCDAKHKLRSPRPS